MTEASKSVTNYRGFQITRNFTSIHGTVGRLAKQRGWNVYLPGYGNIGWEPSMAEVRDTIDRFYAGGCNARIARVLARIEPQESAA